jgi:hypothetical protein
VFRAELQYLKKNISAGRKRKRPRKEPLGARKNIFSHFNDLGDVKARAESTGVPVRRD